MTYGIRFREIKTWEFSYAVAAPPTLFPGRFCLRQIC